MEKFSRGLERKKAGDKHWGIQVWEVGLNIQRYKVDSALMAHWFKKKITEVKEHICVVLSTK